MLVTPLLGRDMHQAAKEVEVFDGEAERAWCVAGY